ncbi:complex proteins associated with Set1p component shg1-domain-containing protein [Zygosaccharomyces rouxii]|nr:complex proteins associated with Set1p component shg1-domain-containing protein [Zygosaccharomyces rouxii]
MTDYNADDARKLADEFKREGYFDQLKRDILTQKHDNDELPLEQSIRNNVASVVRKMVTDDENLIFKNRGSTSALIEAQLFKQGYKRLGEGEDGIQALKIN